MARYDGTPVGVDCCRCEAEIARLKRQIVRRPNLKLTQHLSLLGTSSLIAANAVAKGKDAPVKPVLRIGDGKAKIESAFALLELTAKSLALRRCGGEDPMDRLPSMHLLLAVALGSVTAHQATAQPVGNVQLLPDGKLFIEGKPFLPTGLWCVWNPDSVAYCKAHFMNCLFVPLERDSEGVTKFEKLLRRAERAGVKVIPYFAYGGYHPREKEPPPWTEEQIRQYMRFRRSGAIIGWCLGDDLRLERHLDGVRRTAEIVRRFDPGRPTLGDCNGRPPDDELPFRRYLDIMLPYGYPVATMPFEQYSYRLKLHRMVLGDPLWTWVQIFNTRQTRDTFNVGGWGPGPFPQPEQLRILSYLPFMCGYRGILYFGEHTMRTNAERAGEVAIICAELSLFGEVVAGGEFTDGAKVVATYRAYQVRTATWEQRKRVLIIVLAHQTDAHRYVTDAVRENFPIRVTLSGDYDLTRATGPTIQVHSVTFPKVKPMRFSVRNRNAIDIHVERMDVVGVYLVTEKGEPMIDEIKKRMDEMLPAVARYAVEVASAELAKVQAITKGIAHVGISLPAATSALDNATQTLAQAKRMLEVKQFASAYALARKVLWHCRNAGEAYLKDAFARSAKYALIFYALPQFYKSLRSATQKPAR